MIDARKIQDIDRCGNLPGSAPLTVSFCQPLKLSVAIQGHVTLPFLKESVVSLGSSSRSRTGLSRRDSFKLRSIRAVRHHRVGPERHHPDEARAAGRSAIPCYPTPIDFIEEARPFPRRVLRSPSGGPSTSSGPCAIFKRSGLAVGCPRVPQCMDRPALGDV